MSFFDSLFRPSHVPVRHRPWLGSDFWSPRRVDLEQRLRRRLGRVIRVGTQCGRHTGRLLLVAIDHIVLRVRKRRVLIRLDAICWVKFRPRRRRRRRRKCRRRHRC